MYRLMAFVAGTIPAISLDDELEDLVSILERLIQDAAEVLPFLNHSIC
jgi:hypothetical protein